MSALHYSGKGAEGFIHAARTKPIQFIKEGVPKLFLDASAADCIIKAVSPDCRIVDIAVKRNVETHRSLVFIFLVEISNLYKASYPIFVEQP